MTEQTILYVWNIYIKIIYIFLRFLLINNTLLLSQLTYYIFDIILFQE